MRTAPDQVACWHKAALITDAEGMELLERQPPLAATALGASAAARLTRQRPRALGVRAIPVGLGSATRDDPLGLTRCEREIIAEICAARPAR